MSSTEGKKITIKGGCHCGYVSTKQIPINLTTTNPKRTNTTTTTFQLHNLHRPHHPLPPQQPDRDPLQLHLLPKPRLHLPAPRLLCRLRPALPFLSRSSPTRRLCSKSEERPSLLLPFLWLACLDARGVPAGGGQGDADHGC
jgi:hypothetical protein